MTNFGTNLKQISHPNAGPTRHLKVRELALEWDFSTIISSCHEARRRIVQRQANERASMSKSMSKSMCATRLARHRCRRARRLGAVRPPRGSGATARCRRRISLALLASSNAKRPFCHDARESECESESERAIGERKITAFSR